MIAIREAWLAGLLKRERWLRNLIAGFVVGVVALFGGTRLQIAGPTGAIARTATNVRNGDSGPLAEYVPLAALLQVEWGSKLEGQPGRAPSEDTR